MVSVIIPTRNRDHTLALALESVKHQTEDRWECLVVDDQSDDNTAMLVQEYERADSRFRYLKTPEGQKGAPVARNQGIRESSGEYILFLDSDDALANFCLKTRVAELEASPQLQFGVWPTLLFDATPGDSSLLWNIPTVESDLDRFLALDIPWQTAGVLWRRATLNKLGTWNESLLSWQDWEYHLRALAIGLTYRKFEQPDSYWRTPRNDSIWNHSYHADHLVRRQRLLADIEAILRRENQWNERQKKLMAGLYFWHARLWHSKLRNRLKGLSEWYGAWRRGLVKTSLFLQGCRWFSKLTRGKSQDPRALFPHWPAEYFTGSSRTFQAVHYRAE